MPFTKNTIPGSLSIDRGEAEVFYVSTGRRYLATMRVSGKNLDKKYIDRTNVQFFEPPSISWEPGVNDPLR